jgi:hypothetical protein
MTDDRDVAVEVTIAAPIDLVWRALRERDEIRRWHGWEFDGLDEEIEEIFFTDATEQVADGPDRRLVSAGSVFEVTTRGASTVVRVVLVRPPEHDSWQGWYDDVRQGWLTFVQQLRFALERHRGEDRSTVIVSGVPLDAYQPPVAALLGLDGIPTQAGEPYAATLATGDEVTGRVWFHAEHQRGVTVDGWGDGLLVLTDGVTPAKPVGALLTTYGLDPAVHAELAARWQAWAGKHLGNAVDSSF